MNIKKRDFKWNRVKQFSILQIVLAFSIPSLFAYTGFHIILPIFVKNEFPVLIAWSLVSSVMLTILVIIALLFLKSEAKELHISLASRICLKPLSKKQWIISLTIMIMGFLIALLASQLVNPFMNLLSLEIPNYMPFFLNPTINPTQTHPSILSPDLPLNGAYSILILMGITLILNILAEELYFRAWILPKLSKYGKISWIINGVMFALYHTFQFWLFPTILVGSLIWAFVIFYTKSIFPALVGHLIGNFLFSMLGLSFLVFEISQ